MGLFIKDKTTLVPVAGGSFVEGTLGQPIFINPILSDANEVDSSIARLLFADLNTLSESHKISPDGKSLDIRLKPNISWQDGFTITSDDVIFTINAISNSDINSPLASSWSGINVERISEREIKITSPAKYAYFPNIVLNLRPIPKHIFGTIPVENIRLSNYNLEPIASGPFKFEELKKRRDGFITDYTLIRNEKYFEEPAFLKNFSFKFYTSEDDLIKSFNAGEINGFSLNQYKKIDKVSVPFQLIDIKMPRYYAIFLNPYNNPVLSEKSLRLTMDWAIDKKDIVEKVFGNHALIVNSPLDKSFFMEDYNSTNNHEYSPYKAKESLMSNGWQQNEQGLWEKTTKEGKNVLSFDLIVYPAPFLQETAELIKEYFNNAGIKVEIKTVEASSFVNEVIEPRNYELLLFGNIYGENLDPFSFWHSNQKFSPGLNLSIYEDKNADYLIEAMRSELDPEIREKYLLQLDSLIFEDRPAIFLYSPHYIYIANKSLHGFTDNIISLPSDHLKNITQWHIKSARVIR